MTESTDKPQFDPADEQQLDEYLKGDSSVSRHYRQLHSAEVPAELDRLVLRQAGDAVKARSSNRPAWVRWSAPFAVAASAVLALAIVIETGVQDAMMVSAPEQARQESASVPVETRLIEEDKAQGVAPPEAPASMEPGPDAVHLDVPPPPRALKKEAPTSPAASPAAPPPAAAPQSLARSRAAPPPVSAPAPEESSFSSDPAADTAADTAIQEQVAKAAQADTEAFAAEMAREEERSSALRTLRNEPNQIAGHRSAANTRESAADLRSRPIRADAPTVQRAYSDPETWLKDIRQLRKDNKQEEADREWIRFRMTYPNYNVAEDDTAREAKQ